LKQKQDFVVQLFKSYRLEFAKAATSGEKQEPEGKGERRTGDKRMKSGVVSAHWQEEFR